MSSKIKVVLVPEVNQVQLLFDTMNRYCELCNYISQIVFDRDCSRPINLYYWQVDHNYKNLYHQVRHNFPDVNSNMVTMALRRVPKAYMKNRPSEPLRFSGAVDYSSYMISMTYLSPKPANFGLITISTPAGRQKMQIVFDDSQREKLQIAFNSKKYCEYKLSYQEGTFYLSRNLSDSKIKEHYQTHSKQDPFL